MSLSIALDPNLLEQMLDDRPRRRNPVFSVREIT
jgi:hypothetical protein